ncbi:LysM peptidoglycan-binding domain-containing protein [Flavobacterium amnicola]|uniref:LysM peptidoglycan-binding domain-containing protein n=1 Tax=Flavobacterium amnicola TaxID=2506422 RepID=A0A4Q1K3P6_9FLAO|nr:LysM peptidoglycan-binding domain-containing protein [Flavobacterium amnicola]RXR19419.1 LysM peptidoglycan-binding domain-containing protein [Flavobacterium amnicola]
MKKVIWCLVVMCCSFLFAQTNVVKHKVAKGESITKIAQKYAVTPLDIYKLNPDAQAGISENMLLLIPKKTAAIPPKIIEAKTVKHTVAAKETLYSISKLYETTVADIESKNSEVKNGLSIGQVLNITVKRGWVKPQETVLHEVKPKETKYGIAKQYGITVEKLEKKNPEIIGKELPLGFVLVIKGQKSAIELPKAEQPKVELPMVKPAVVNDTYTVKPQETLYGLANQFACSQEELIALNPELKDGVRDGMILKIPAKKAVPIKKDYADLTKSLKKNGTKKAALLLPFNITKLDQDTINSTKSRLKKDKFLNMTLDFYSGALMAIDSVKKLGVAVDVTILDSDETKSTSNVSNLIRENNLKSFDAVIGPFYQNNVEKTAEILGSVPVFSPLSKDYDKKYANLIQATPSNDDIKNAMFDFMRAKGGNMVAIIDPKKQSIKQFIVDNHKDVQFVNFTDKGVLDVAQLKSLLVAGKENFVVMETEKTNLILSITTNLLSLQKQFDIKLVILGENEALDFEEIQMSRLTKLKMHYPSQFSVNNSDEAAIFDTNYKKKNKIFPNQFATRGFDMTFDVLLRLSQEKPILETLNETASQQIESRFNYVSNPEGGFINKGVHILYYDTDLTIKQAN